jgi:hypothetical protein
MRSGAEYHTYHTYISTQQLDRTRTGWPTLFIIIFYLYLSIYPIYRARFHNLEEPLRETNLASLSISALIYQAGPLS